MQRGTAIPEPCEMTKLRQRQANWRANDIVEVGRVDIERPREVGGVAVGALERSVGQLRLEQRRTHLITTGECRLSSLSEPP